MCLANLNLDIPGELKEKMCVIKLHTELRPWCIYIIANVRMLFFYSFYFFFYSFLHILLEKKKNTKFCL